ncbi:MAG: lipopolysaccharide heptosyltransferase II [Candidatus Omnitrophica bacterium]|nr:lipopolysaccharide heptosyltransferase II [Candidatus Omnitrophota bacterium]
MGPNRILVVNVNWLGDVLFSTPLIRALRQKFPDAYIACMVVPRCKEILTLNPHLDEVIIYDEGGRHKGLIGKFKIVSYLKSQGFDTAILLHRSFTRTLIVFLAGIGRRIGYYTKKRAALLTEAVEPPPEDMHRVDVFLNLGKTLGINLKNRDYEFFISDEDRKNAGFILENTGIGKTDRFVVINPGGNWAPKRWPVGKFAKLADELIKRFGLKVAITGSRRDIRLGEHVASLMKEKPAVLCGKTTLRELAAVMEKAKVVIANDSGPMHISISMTAKTAALFGPTSPQITGPIGKGDFAVLREHGDCDIPCYKVACEYYKCMDAITVDGVLKAIHEFIR